MLCILAAGCSSTTKVHLFAKYMSEQQVQAIVTELDKSKFSVEVNRQEFPVSIGSNTLVYAPSTGIRHKLNLLMPRLENLGFPIVSADLLMANNHSFTENNVGLYLIPEGVNTAQEPPIDLAVLLPVINEYGGVDCADATTLYLKDEREFVLEINRWQASIDDYHQHQITGRWQLRANNLVELSNEQWQQPLIFQRSEFERKEINGRSKGFIFTPTTRLATNNQLSLINCRYSISVALE